MERQSQNLDFPRCGAVRSLAFASLLPLRTRVAVTVMVAGLLHAISSSAAFDPVQSVESLSTDGDRPAVFQAVYEAEGAAHLEDGQDGTQAACMQEL